jgi:hypothetical protein
MAKIKLNGKEYDFKFTNRDWKTLSDEFGINPDSAREKMVGGNMAEVIVVLIYYGLPADVRKADGSDEAGKISMDELYDITDMSFIDEISEAIEEGLPKRLVAKQEALMAKEAVSKAKEAEEESKKKPTNG